MIRYPHYIVIQKPISSENPYEEVQYETVFEGLCRCFLDRVPYSGGGDLSQNNYQAVIPSPRMPNIGENYKVGVKVGINTDSYDHVGYVRVFARYDRVCNVYFEVIKDHMIEEDQP